MLSLVAQVLRRICGKGPHLARYRVLGANDQARFVFDAVVGQHGSGLRELQHREGVVALANTKRNGFPWVPALLLDFFVGFLFPVLAG